MFRFSNFNLIAMKSLLDMQSLILIMLFSNAISRQLVYILRGG